MGLLQRFGLEHVVRTNKMKNMWVLSEIAVGSKHALVTKLEFERLRLLLCLVVCYVLFAECCSLFVVGWLVYLLALRVCCRCGEC